MNKDKKLNAVETLPTRRSKHKKIGEKIFYWSILAIPLLQFVLMYVVVNFNSILLAFEDIKFNQEGQMTVAFAGLENFKLFISQVFKDPVMITRFINSFIVYGANLFVGTVLAILFSYFIFKKYPLSGFFRVVLMLPSMICSVAIVLIYKYIMDEAIPAMMGTPGAGLLALGSDSQVLFLVIICNILMGFGSGVLMYSNAMSRIPDSLLEAARLEGCSPIQEFFHIILPMIYPTVETFLIIGLSGLFIDQANLYTFYGKASNVQTVGYFLFTQVIGDSTVVSEYPYAAAAGLTLTAVTIPVVMIAKHFLNKLDKGVEF